MSVPHDSGAELIHFSEEFQFMLDEYFHIQCRYQAAIRQVQTKLEILNLEFETKHRRNPIHHMEHRMKTLQSITEKLQRKNMEVSINSVSVKRVNDYIHHPKPNGYRSLHLVIEVPVFLAEGRMMVPVEVQIRTIAMDFWASLEHNLRYKADGIVPQDIADELLRTAQDIAAIDERMQTIHDRMSQLDLKAPRQLSLFDDQ